MIDSFEEFSDLLNSELSSIENYNNTCLISGENLQDIHVELPCHHKYNYYSIYREIINQRKTHRICKPKIQCPYCRSYHKYVLPYIKMDGVDKIKWVNYPEKYQLLPNKCVYKFKKYDNKACNKACMNDMCPHHTNISKNNNVSPESIESVTSQSDINGYTVTTLRAIAKYHKIKRYSNLKKTQLIDLIHKSLN